MIYDCDFIQNGISAIIMQSGTSVIQESPWVALGTVAGAESAAKIIKIRHVPFNIFQFSFIPGFRNNRRP